MASSEVCVGSEDCSAQCLHRLNSADDARHIAALLAVFGQQGG